MRRWLVLLVCFSLVACVGAGAAASPLKGVFEAKIKSSNAQLKGTWLISFAGTGAYAVAKEPSSTLLIGGSSSVSGHTLTMTDQTGPLACKGGQARATYSWSLSGKKLTLKAVKDACAGRSLILAGAFTKVA